jgi:hypothetical protein
LAIAWQKWLHFDSDNFFFTLLHSGREKLFKRIKENRAQYVHKPIYSSKREEKLARLLSPFGLL